LPLSKPLKNVEFADLDGDQSPGSGTRALVQASIYALAAARSILAGALVRVVACLFPTTRRTA
jgi:hypothetical protein